MTVSATSSLQRKFEEWVKESDKDELPGLSQVSEKIKEIDKADKDLSALRTEMEEMLDRSPQPHGTETNYERDLEKAVQKHDEKSRKIGELARMLTDLSASLEGVPGIQSLLEESRSRLENLKKILSLVNLQTACNEWLRIAEELPEPVSWGVNMLVEVGDPNPKQHRLASEKHEKELEINEMMTKLDMLTNIEAYLSDGLPVIGAIQSIVKECQIILRLSAQEEKDRREAEAEQTSPTVTQSFAEAHVDVSHKNSRPAGVSGLIKIWMLLVFLLCFCIISINSSRKESAIRPVIPSGIRHPAPGCAPIEVESWEAMAKILVSDPVELSV